MSALEPFSNKLNKATVRDPGQLIVIIITTIITITITIITTTQQ